MPVFDRKKFILDMVLIVVGAASYAAAFCIFLTPAGIAPGGLSGLGIIANTLFGLPVGTVMLVLNIPLIIMALKVLGKRFLFKTCISVIVSSVLIDVGAGFLPALHLEEPLMAAIFGGVMMGFGLGLVFSRGGSNGGSDIISRLLYRKRPYMSIGQVVLCVDLSIIALSAVVSRDIATGLYGVIALYISSRVMDFLIQGANTAKLAYIITNRANAVSAAICQDIRRGTTLLEGQGGYSKCHKNIIMCVARPQEVPHLKNLVRAIDPEAFVILTNAYEVMGTGFHQAIT